jgi:hypothetical protein
MPANSKINEFINTVIYKAPVDKKMPGVCPDLTNDSVMMASKNKER